MASTTVLRIAYHVANVDIARLLSISGVAYHVSNVDIARLLSISGVLVFCIMAAGAPGHTAVRKDVIPVAELRRSGGDVNLLLRNLARAWLQVSSAEEFICMARGMEHLGNGKDFGGWAAHAVVQ
ncbi:hypothetical protein NDU88_004827 [Pleurodeles waltl]|uniref:Uncharacterized protein n=1 Tax=Pleurodeles waltl TaxID=8319 RepID=A0AAV7NM63_PLEWA|nr:hypothetical protein NDU88_004827 [Pleurodeles waltl]